MRIFAAWIVTILVSLTATADITVINNVTALTMENDRIISHATVMVSGDRIIYVGESSEAPTVHDVVEIIDGNGQFLIPGLTEMHGHLPFTSWSDEERERILFLYLAGGVTTVRGMLGDPVQFELRDMITAGEIAGPTLYLAAPSLNGNTVASPAHGRQLIRQYAAEGWDLQKIHPGLTRAEYDAIAEEANGLNFPFGGHVPAEVGLERAMDAGQISMDHMDGYLQMFDGGQREMTDQDFAALISMTKRSGTWVVPTQELFNLLIGGGDIETLSARPENQYITPEQLRRYRERAQQANNNANSLAVENRQRLLKALADAGVNIALGSDAPQLFSVPGFSIWREIEVMKAAGLSDKQILNIGTQAPGRYFADKDSFGTISEGSRADLILLNANPYDGIEAVFDQVGVMAAGRWFNRAEIDARLNQITADVR